MREVRNEVSKALHSGCRRLLTAFDEVSSNFEFTPQNVDTNITTFESVVIEDIKNHDKRTLRSNNLTKGEIYALRNLSEREDIIITRADKGGATVIWGIDEYLTEANNQLNNTKFYRKLTFDPFQGYIRIINNSLDELHFQNKINAEKH